MVRMVPVTTMVKVAQPVLLLPPDGSVEATEEAAAEAEAARETWMCMEETAAQVAVMMPISLPKKVVTEDTAQTSTAMFTGTALMVTPSAEAEEALATAAAMVAEAEAACMVVTMR
jgi:hypothetical protein